MTGKVENIKEGSQYGNPLFFVQNSSTQAFYKTAVNITINLIY